MDRVLLIEDEPVYSAMLAGYLTKQGYDVRVANTGEEALILLPDTDADVILLDLGLPDVDGMDICRQIRLDGDTPVIIVSAKDDSTERVLGLELGADDFVDKRMPRREILARIRAVRRRAGVPDSRPQNAVAHGYTVDRDARQVVDERGELISLTHLEFELLWLFVSHRGKAIDRLRIYEQVWQQELLGSGRTIDTHVRTLRQKLVNLQLTTVRGVGYRLERDPNPSAH